MKSIISIKKHYHSIDLFKGCLIILVIVGHILPGAINNNIARYTIYGFHMPLFIAITGYLANFEKLKTQKLQDTAGKYLFRVLIPWGIAIVGYHIYNHHSFNPGGIVVSFLEPYYHLWYITAIVVYIFLTLLQVKLNISRKTILTCSFFLSAAVGFYFAIKGTEQANQYLYLLRPQFYFFFCLGVYYNQYKTKDTYNTFVSLASIALPFAAFIACFYYPNLWLQQISFFLFNAAIVSYLISNINNSNIPVCKPIEWIGKNSLPIYLWHVMVILQLKAIKPLYADPLIYYSASAASQLLLMALIWAISKIKIINKFAFGG